MSALLFFITFILFIVYKKGSIRKSVEQQKKITAKARNFFSAVFAGSLISSQSCMGLTLCKPCLNPLLTLRLNKPKNYRKVR
jgi:hypothetical protein